MVRFLVVELCSVVFLGVSSWIGVGAYFSPLFYCFQKTVWPRDARPDSGVAFFRVYLVGWSRSVGLLHLEDPLYSYRYGACPDGY